MAADEEALIQAVLRVRLAGAGTAAECHAAIAAEEAFADVTLAQVKKAAGKATKRTAKEEAAKPAAAAAPAPVSEAKQAKQAKAQAAELKSAENAMMDAQRRLRAAKSGGDMTAMAVTIDGTVEEFIQQATMKAMAGILDAGEERFLKERIEADIAALEWVKLAQKANVLSLKEDVCALGGELQLTRLKEVRGCRSADLPAALACFKRVTGDGGYQDVDKSLARTGALAAGNGQEGALDDVD